MSDFMGVYVEEAQAQDVNVVGNYRRLADKGTTQSGFGWLLCVGLSL